MSQAKRQLPESSQKQSQDSTQPSIQHSSHEPFAKFDDRIATASDRIFPKQPYLITIPSEKPFRRHANDQTRWYRQTPFAKQEEQLQYMSFLLHQDDDEVLMRVDGTRIDEDGRLLAPAQSPRSESQSRPQTPLDTGPKKKISLKDYKTKDKSAINTPERKPNDDIRRQAIKSRKEEVDAKLGEHDTKNMAEKNTQKPEPVRKPAPATATPKDDHKAATGTPTAQDKDSQRPAKKRRLSAEENKTPVVRTNGVNSKEASTDKRSLPTLLSPDMPSADKQHKAKGLPELLSPKLPLSLEKAVNAPPPRSEEVKAIMKATLGSPSRSSDKKEISKEPSTGRIRSESQLSVKSATGLKPTSPIPRPLSSASNKATLSNGQTGSPARKPPPRGIKLRYGKKNSKRVLMLLKMESRVKRTPAVPLDKERSAQKSVSQVGSIKTERKRSPEAASDVPVKKTKLATPSLELLPKQERPTTPRADAGGKSPSAGKHKSAFSTPKKDVKSDLKSITMQRVASSDTTGVRTPSQEAGRTSTPLGVSHTSHPKTSPAPASTPAKSDDHVTWNDINAKVFQIGRALKKEGAKLAAEGKGKDQARGVVMLIEGLVCFMLVSAAQAQARPNNDPGWSTILPYHVMVWRHSRPYRHLHGLVVQLGAVCRQYLNYEQIKRLAKETLPDDHMTSAPTPGSDGLTRGSDDLVKKQKSFIELRDELVTNSKELRTAWLDGPRLLAPDVIEEQYPKTWAKRSTDLSKRNPDRVDPKDITKDFYIPVDVTTNVFEASNFALSFLYEWTLIEGVQWKTQIDLGAS